MNHEDFPSLQVFRESLRERAAEDAASARRLSLRRLPGPVLAALVAIVALVPAGGVAYAVLSGGDGSVSAGIACYANPERQGAIVATQVDGRLATQTCAALWREGRVDARQRSAPTLQACVAASGDEAISVIPAATPAACERLGLVAKPDAGAGSGPYAALSQALWHEERACPTRERAQALAEAELRRLDMTGWTVVDATQPDAGHPCTAFGFDSGKQQISLVSDAP